LKVEAVGERRIYGGVAVGYKRDHLLLEAFEAFTFDITIFS
jgi:hypothetical protein